MQIVFEQHAVDYDGRDRSGDESDVPLGSLDPPKVTHNHIKDGERLAQLEVWAQNGNREVTP